MAAGSRGGPGCLLTGCLAVIALIVVVVGGGYLAFQSGAITQDTLLGLVGQGPGRVEVDNFRDDEVQVSIRQTDVSGDTTPSTYGLTLSPFDVRTQRVQQPGKYRVEFRTSAGAILGVCALTLGSGDAYQFVTLPDKIVVNRGNRPPSTGQDLIVQTSSLCR